MTYQQIKTPNPNIACIPGWCLSYVESAFGVTHQYPTAIADWNASKYKHQDQNFGGLDVPVFFSDSAQPDGHVAVKMADGTVYSASNPTATTPMHFPSVAALQGYYGGRLTYLGWTQDCGGTLVVQTIATPAPAVGAKIATVEKALANVRNAPHATAPLAGSLHLYEGQTFGYVAVVDGDSVNGNNKWLQSTLGHYVWSGGIKY